MVFFGIIKYICYLYIQSLLTLRYTYTYIHTYIYIYIYNTQLSFHPPVFVAIVLAEVGMIMVRLCAVILSQQNVISTVQSAKKVNQVNVNHQNVMYMASSSLPSLHSLFIVYTVNSSRLMQELSSLVPLKVVVMARQTMSKNI